MIHLSDHHDAFHRIRGTFPRVPVNPLTELTADCSFKKKAVQVRFETVIKPPCSLGIVGTASCRALVVITVLGGKLLIVVRRERITLNDKKLIMFLKFIQY